MKKSKLLLAKSIGCFLLVGILFSSCNNNDDDNLPGSPTPGQTATKVKTYGPAPLSARFEVPAHMDRNEIGTYSVEIFDNRKLYFVINVVNLSSSDSLTVAHIHTGGPLESGGVFVGLVDNNTIKFDPENPSARDSVALTEDQYQRLLAGNDLYINVHSIQQPAGLLRNQLGNPLKYGADIALLPGNEVPAVVSRASGTAMIRIAADETVYSNVTVNNLDPGDALTEAHIHTGAPGVNGPNFVFLANNASEFGVNRSFDTDGSVFNTIASSPVYINAHSTMHPNGLVRGQLRE